MKTRTETITKTYYSSEVIDLETDNPYWEKLIEFCDQNPVLWKIITTKKSKAWGIGSSMYIGWAQKSTSTDAILQRAKTFCDYLKQSGFFAESAQFTLRHFNDKKFTGGFFRSYDGKYDRSCATLDFTPETQNEVIARFYNWCCTEPHPIKKIYISGVVVREY